jgi:hypothetical protein
LFVAALIAFTPPSPVPVAGRVVRIVGHDTVSVAGARVVLHRVTARASGPVDSTVSDARGKFAFRIAPDSGVVYLVSARWSAIEYFATPVVVHVDSPTPPVTVIVSDTSASAPVVLAARHLIVSPVTAEGTRDVVDLFVLENRGPRTRVSADSLRPTWQVRLPSFAINVRGGNSDFALESLRPIGDTVALYAAVPPGRRDIEIDYEIPPNTTRFDLPVDVNVASSNIVSADRTLRVLGSYVRSDTVIDGKVYARWEGAMTAGHPVILQFGSGALPAWLVPAMVGAMAVVLVLVTWRATKGTSGLS